LPLHFLTLCNMHLEISIWYIVVRFSYYNLIIGKGMILIGKIIK
jgi:hypothetical protein